MIYEDKINDLRAVYQKWQGQRNKSDIEKELASIELVQKSYNNYQEAVKNSGQKSPYEETVSGWWSDIEKRKKEIAAEKDLYKKIQQSYSLCQKKSDLAKDLQEANDCLKLIKEYQDLAGRLEISIYHQNDVREVQKKTQKQQLLLAKEQDVSTKLKTSHEKYAQQKFTSLEEEKKALTPILAIVKEYKIAMSLKQMSEYHKKEIEELIAKYEGRNSMVTGEEALFNLVKSSVEGWQKKKNGYSTAIAKQVIGRILEHCDNYQSKQKKQQISSYHAKQITSWQQEINSQKQQIVAEENLFKGVAKLQTEYLSNTSFASAEKEQKALQQIATKIDEYTKKYPKHSRKQLNEWQKSNSQQLEKLNAEKELFSKLESSYQKAQKQQSDAKAEQVIVVSVMELCKDYQKKLVEGKISRYHQKTVRQYLDKMKQRNEMLTNELQAFAQIQKGWQELSTLKHKSLNEERSANQKVLSLCENYNREQKQGKSSNYSQKQVDEWTAELTNKVKQYQELVKIIEQLNASYSNWKRVTRWPSSASEETALAKIAKLVNDYKSKIKEYQVKDYHSAETQEASAKVSNKQQMIEAEKKLIEEIKSLRKNVTEKASSLAEGKKKFQNVLDLCKKYQEQANSKKISNHSQRNLSRWERRLRTQMSKLEKEEKLFQNVEHTYNFWKKRSWADDIQGEKRALEKALKQTTEYKEESQFKKITDYHKSQVKEYEKELRSRQTTLKK